MIDPHQILLILAVAIWIDGLWLIKCLLWKRKPVTTTTQTLKAKKEAKVADLSDLGYRDPWEREVH